MILINFKIYKETWGEKGIELAKICKEVSDKTKIRIVIAASPLEAVRLHNQTGAEVWLQNIDDVQEGKHTGWISATQAMELGIKGSLLNHSEHQLAKGEVMKIVKNKPKDFEIMACVKSLGQIEKWAYRLKAEYLLYEPPELIGSTTDSVASRPESIKRAAELCKKTHLVVGAGVKSKEDVATCLKMGAKSVGLASGFVLSNNPRQVLEDITSGFNV